MIDLHLHTTASDGLLTPRELVHRAAAAGLTTIAVTDHDTIAGLEEAGQAGAAVGMRVVPGIEITAVENERDVHVLGYFLDPLLHVALRDALEPSHEFQILDDLHLRVQRRDLGQIPDPLLHIHGVSGHIESGHLGAPFGGRQKAGEHAHRGSLARAVGTEKAHDLALLDFKRHVVHGERARIALRQAFDFDHKFL